MNRRTLVTTGLTALASSSVAASPQDKAGSAAGPTLVRAGESRAGAPWLIAGTSPITVKVGSTDVAGRYCVIEVETPPGRGPDLHIHLAQNELFFVLKGRIGVVCGEQRIVLNAGDSFLAPLGVPHAFVTLGTENARVLYTFDPAGKMEMFFEAYAKLIPAHGPPDVKAIGALSDAAGLKVVGPPLSPTSFA